MTRFFTVDFPRSDLKYLCAHTDLSRKKISSVCLLHCLNFLPSLRRMEINSSSLPFNIFLLAVCMAITSARVHCNYFSRDREKNQQFPR